MMDIEELVQKYYAAWARQDVTMTQALEAALTELAAGYEQKIAGLESETILSRALSDRISQLESERVLDGIVVSSDWLRRIHRDLDACQKVIWLGMRDADPAYCADAKARLKEIDAMLAAAPRRCHLCDYQHGHKIGCVNNPVDIALRAATQQPKKEGE